MIQNHVHPVHIDRLEGGRVALVVIGTDAGDLAAAFTTDTSTEEGITATIDAIRSFRPGVPEVVLRAFLMTPVAGETPAQPEGCA